MEQITSFNIDHNKMEPGLYISRIDDDITTYDIRTRKPNCGNYMDNITMHSLEHLFATYARNSKYKDKIIYFGPMGCQTGFYFLVRNMNNDDAIALIKSIFNQILTHKGKVFGSKKIECGNYRNLSTSSAKKEAYKFLKILEE